MKPLISVVIPAYNVGRYIGNTLNSVLSQTFRDFEIIVVNDGSTDDTETVARKILKQADVPSRIITQVNRGVSVARNVGIDNSQGYYVKFLDGDDILEREALEVLVKACESRNFPVAFGKQDVITYHGRRIYSYEEMYEIDWEVAEYKQAIVELLTGKIHIGCNSALFQTQILRANNIYFRPGAKYNEDNEFIAKVLFFAKKVIYVDKLICHAVMREDSSTKAANLSVFHNVASIKRLMTFFKNVCDEEIAQIIMNQVLPFAYVWTLGVLAYNGYPLKKWLDLTRNSEIRFHLNKFMKSFVPKTKIQQKFLILKRLYKISPVLAYFLLKTLGNFHRRIK